MITKQSLILTFNMNYDRKRSPCTNQETTQLNDVEAKEDQSMHHEELVKIEDSLFGQLYVKLRCTNLGMQVIFPRQQKKLSK